MNIFYGSIRKKLMVLVLLATMPVFIVLLTTELHNRQDAIMIAEKDAALYLSGFAEMQQRITNSTEILLRTVASIPEISSLDVDKSRVVLATLLEANPIYTNVILVDLEGDVIAAGKNHDRAKKFNFSDRKQFKEAIASKGFASGEFVVGKSSLKSIFPFGMAVQNKQGELAGAIIIGVSLAHYGEIFERGDYPKNSFFGLCDHKGIRLFRYPFSDQIKIGEPIKKKVYQSVAERGTKGTLTALTSDGEERILAFEPLRLAGSETPYIYMFIGIDAKQLHTHAQSIINRLIITGSLSLVLALIIAWYIGGRSVARQFDRLSLVTRKFSQGEKNVTTDIDYSDGEIGGLAQSFDNMVKIIHQRDEEKNILTEQLNQAQKIESIGQLAGGVAHDFNNMLGVILGHTEMALKKVGKDEKLSAHLEQVFKAATRSAELTRQLLTFARKQVIAPKVLDLNETVGGMLKMLQRLIGENIQLVWEPDPELWLVNIDPSQADQILANLCVNARDAIRGNGKITISTRNTSIDEAYSRAHSYGLRPGDYVQLSISDDGCGMDKEIQEHIFEPFYTTKDLGAGTGLGLATVHGAVKQNDGFIAIYSEPGHGTVINIYFPRETEKGKPEEASAPTKIHRGDETILLVEDDAMVLQMHATMLENCGYRVLTSSNPKDALSLEQRSSDFIHLLITDMIMPGMSGRELAAMFHDLRPESKVLFMSGYSPDLLSKGGKIEEGIHFLQKPVSFDMLTTKVRELLDGQQ